MKVSIALMLLAALASGCIDPTSLKKAEPAPSAPAAAPVAPADHQAAPAPNPAAPPVIPDVPPKLVDKRKALADNPALVEGENKINAIDPLSAASQSYFNMASRIYLESFKHTIDLYKAEHDKNPTFAEFEDMLKQSNVQFKGLKPWQVYAYDDVDGTVCILEDKAEKKKRYDAIGLEYKE